MPALLRRRSVTDADHDEAQHSVKSVFGRVALDMVVLGEYLKVSEVAAMPDMEGPIAETGVCNSDTFRVSKMDSKQIEKVSLFYREESGCRRRRAQLVHAIVNCAVHVAFV